MHTKRFETESEETSDKKKSEPSYKPANVSGDDDASSSLTEEDSSDDGLGWTPGGPIWKKSADPYSSSSDLYWREAFVAGEEMYTAIEVWRQKQGHWSKDFYVPAARLKSILPDLVLEADCYVLLRDFFLAIEIQRDRIKLSSEDLKRSSVERFLRELNGGRNDGDWAYGIGDGFEADVFKGIAQTLNAISAGINRTRFAGSTAVSGMRYPASRQLLLRGEPKPLVHPLKYKTVYQKITLAIKILADTGGLTNYSQYPLKPNEHKAHLFASDRAFTQRWAQNAEEGFPGWTDFLQKLWEGNAASVVKFIRENGFGKKPILFSEFWRQGRNDSEARAEGASSSAAGTGVNAENPSTDFLHGVQAAGDSQNASTIRGFSEDVVANQLQSNLDMQRVQCDAAFLNSTIDALLHGADVAGDLLRLDLNDGERQRVMEVIDQIQLERYFKDMPEDMSSGMNKADVFVVTAWLFMQTCFWFIVKQVYDDRANEQEAERPIAQASRLTIPAIRAPKAGASSTEVKTSSERNFPGKGSQTTGYPTEAGSLESAAGNSAHQTGTMHGMNQHARPVRSVLFDGEIGRFAGIHIGSGDIDLRESAIMVLDENLVGNQTQIINVYGDVSVKAAYGPAIQDSLTTSLVQYQSDEDPAAMLMVFAGDKELQIFKFWNRWVQAQRLQRQINNLQVSKERTLVDPSTDVEVDGDLLIVFTEDRPSAAQASTIKLLNPNSQLSLLFGQDCPELDVMPGEDEEGFFHIVSQHDDRKWLTISWDEEAGESPRKRVETQIKKRWVAESALNPDSMTISRATEIVYNAKYDASKSVTLTKDRDAVFVEVAAQLGAELGRVFTPNKGFLYRVNGGLIAVEGDGARSLHQAFEIAILRRDPPAFSDQIYPCPTNGLYRFYGSTKLYFSEPVLSPMSRTYATIDLQIGAELLLDFADGYQALYSRLSGNGKFLYLYPIAESMDIPMLAISGSPDQLSAVKGQCHAKWPSKIVRNPSGNFEVTGETVFIFNADIARGGRCKIVLREKPGLDVEALFAEKLTVTQESRNGVLVNEFWMNSHYMVEVETDDDDFLAFFTDKVSLSSRTVFNPRGIVNVIGIKHYLFDREMYDWIRQDGGDTVTFNLDDATEPAEFSFLDTRFALFKNEPESQMAGQVIFGEYTTGFEKPRAIKFVARDEVLLERQVKVFEEALYFCMRMPLNHVVIDADKDIYFDRPWKDGEFTRLQVAGTNRRINFKLPSGVYLYESNSAENILRYRNVEGRLVLVIDCDDDRSCQTMRSNMYMASTSVGSVPIETKKSLSRHVELDFTDQANSETQVFRITDSGKYAPGEEYTVSVSWPKDSHGRIAVKVGTPLYNPPAEPLSRFSVEFDGKAMVVEAPQELANAIFEDLKAQTTAADQALFSSFVRGNLRDADNDYPVFNASIDASYNIGGDDQRPSNGVDVLFIKGTTNNNFRFFPPMHTHVILDLPDDPVADEDWYVDFSALVSQNPYAIGRVRSDVTSTNEQYEIGRIVFSPDPGDSFSVWRYFGREVQYDILLTGERSQVESLTRVIDADVVASQRAKAVMQGTASPVQAGPSRTTIFWEAFLSLPTSARTVMKGLNNGGDVYTEFRRQLWPSAVDNAAPLSDSSLQPMQMFLDTAYSLARAMHDEQNLSTALWERIAAKVRIANPTSTSADLKNLTVKQAKELNPKRDRIVNLLWRNAMALIDSAASPQDILEKYEDAYNPTKMWYADLCIRLAAMIEERSPDIASDAFWESLKALNHDIISVEINYEKNAVTLESRWHETYQESVDPIFTKPFKDELEILDILDGLTDEEGRKFGNAEMSSVDAKGLLMRLMVEGGSGVPRFEVESGPSYTWRMAKKRFGFLFESAIGFDQLAVSETLDPKPIKKKDRIAMAGMSRRGFSVKTVGLKNAYFGTQDDDEWIQLTTQVGTVLVEPKAANNYFKSRYGQSMFGVDVKILDKSDKAGRGVLFLSGALKTKRAFDKWREDPSDAREFIDMIGAATVAQADRTNNFPLKVKGNIALFVGDVAGLLQRKDPANAKEEVPDSIPGPKAYDVDSDSWRRRHGLHYIDPVRYRAYAEALRNGM